MALRVSVYSVAFLAVLQIRKWGYMDEEKNDSEYFIISVCTIGADRHGLCDRIIILCRSLL